MTEEKKTIEISQELYDAIQQLKWVFGEITWQKIESDEETISILVQWFIDSLNSEQGWTEQWSDENNSGNSNIIT